MPVVYRAALPADGEAIAALWFEANRARRDGLAVAGVDPSVISRRIGATGASGFVAHDGGDVVGSAILSPALANRGAGAPIEGLAHLNTVAVDPRRWGEGIARTLIDLVVERARASGYVRIQLYTQPDNTRARDLYERNGWALTGEQAVDDAGDVLDRYLRDV
jgi:ribosomal protein S18 acetylase RimI-like enzyme